MSDQRVIRVVRAVQKGVHALKDLAEQVDEPRSVAVVVSALVASERNPHSHLVQRLIRQAASQQQPDGSWNHELWDTTWMVRALLDVGYSVESTEVQRAVRFIWATQDPIDGTWYEEPFETTLVLDLLFRIRHASDDAAIQKALNWLASLQREDGQIVGTRYTGMVVSLFRALPSDDPRRRAVIGRGVGYLRASLASRGIWTAAAWSNCYALSALFDTGHDLSDASVEAAVDWFIENQDNSGRWKQVSQVHDTAMAVLVLSNLLTVPMVDLTPPQVAVLHVNRENGSLRVGFVPPGSGAIVPTERMKLSELVRAELGANQQLALSTIGRTRSGSADGSNKVTLNTSELLLKRIGQYAYGHLIPPRIQAMLEDSTADHLRMDVDERLIDLPWELAHDGQDFLCIRYAAGRRLVSEGPAVVATARRAVATDASALVVADPTGDLPAARLEGQQVSDLLIQKGVRVEYRQGNDVRKKDFLLALRDYDIVHYAGHATHVADSPDESCLMTCDGPIQAFEIARFLKSPCPSVVFLNACWSAEELRDPDAYSPMMRGLGRTFMYAGVAAFVGYLVPVPDASATRFAREFYSSLSVGFSIGESVRRSRILIREGGKTDLTWASAVLYGDPSVGIFRASPA